MANRSASKMASRSIVGFYYYSVARFFAGLFFRTANPILSGT